MNFVQPIHHDSVQFQRTEKDTKVNREEMWLQYLLVVNNRRKQEPSFANCLIKHQILITKVIRNIWQMGGDFLLRS